MSKYHREVSSTSIDVYDVLVAWDVRNPAIQHAIKKLLQPGNRGHKDTIQDLTEAIQSIERGIVIERNSSGKVDDDWIKWSGGARPVPCETLVAARLRCGDVIKWQAGEVSWGRGKGIHSSREVIAYRVVKEKEE